MTAEKSPPTATANDPDGAGPSDRLWTERHGQERARRSLQLRLTAAERKAAALAARLEGNGRTIASMLGEAILDAGRSFEGLVALPRRLVEVRREDLRRRKAYRAGRKPAAIVAPATPTAEKTLPLLPSAPPGGTWRIAAIMDSFSAHAFAPDCTLRLLSLDTWQQEIADFKPDFVLVESAWQGAGGSWAGLIHGGSRALAELTDWCAQCGIPTAFWNKEDPVHFSGFLNAARLFDHVFTTDFDSIPAYRAALKHDRVHLLPFGIQPRHFNPLEEMERSDRFFFAGSYYHKYPQRRADFAVLADFALTTHRLDIYDRNIARSGKNFLYPEAYLPHVVGDLPPDQMPALAKAYRFALNLNTVKQSQTMAARRVFELLASNTLVISNFARAIRQLFGDLVIASDNMEEIQRQWSAITADSGVADRIRLAGVRKVMAEHTIAHRLATITAVLAGQNEPLALSPAITVVAPVASLAEASRIRTLFSDQRHARRNLVFVVQSPDLRQALQQQPGARAISPEELIPVVVEAEWTSFWAANDHYGPHFLTDLALATAYWDGEAIGKRARFARQGDDIVLREGDLRYLPCREVDVRCAILRGDAAVRAAACVRDDPGRWLLPETAMLAVDPYNYCRDGSDLPSAQVCAQVNDLAGLWSGAELADFTVDPVATSPAAECRPYLPDIGCLAVRPTAARDGKIRLTRSGTALVIRAKVPPAAHCSAKVTTPFPMRSTAIGSGYRVRSVMAPPDAVGSVRIVHEFLDREGVRIGHQTTPALGEAVLAPPPGTAATRLSLRVGATTAFQWKSLELDAPAPELGFAPVPVARALLIARQYPSYADRYRYPFVHTRACAYRDAGMKVDVFRFVDQPPSDRFAEFEGIDVLSGGHDDLTRMLAHPRCDHAMVHFLDRGMWQVLKPALDRIRVTVWVHGAEIHAPERRSFGKPVSDDGSRLAFWREVMGTQHPNLRFVFVSRTLLQQAEEDLRMPLRDHRIAIINNPIDGAFFRFREKPPELARKVLMLRPFQSRIQANDLAVDAILALADQPDFESLSFTIAGDGPLFEKTVAPLRGMANVTIHKGFLSRREIRQLHEEHGVFLCATRMDSQGVSRDEAMASGLVPVTNDAGAIREFVSAECGFIAPAEDSRGLANAIATLASDPARFARMSCAAAKAVRARSELKQVTDQEIQWTFPASFPGHIPPEWPERFIAQD